MSSFAFQLRLNLSFVHFSKRVHRLPGLRDRTEAFRSNRSTKGYIHRTTVKVAMDQQLFEDLFSGLSRGRSRFDVTAEDLDNLLPAGWSKRAFRTSTKCVVS